MWGDKRYFLRLAPGGEPDAPVPLEAKNGKPARPQQTYLDAGFLELVRYGLCAAPTRRRSPPACPNSTTRPSRSTCACATTSASPVSPGTYPGWRRYGDDGYGEDTKTGAGFGAVHPSGKDSPDQARAGVADLHRRARPL